MKFHEYRLIKTCGHPATGDDLTTEEYYQAIYKRMLAGFDFGQYEPMLLCEISYVSHKRPFYNVYPAVSECLKNTSLDFRLSQISALPETVAMCFAEGHEPTTQSGKVRSMLVELTSTMTNGETEESFDVPMLRIATDVAKPDGSRGFECFYYCRKEKLSEYIEIIGIKKELVSLAVGVALLAQDERFAEPILLKKDQGKKLDSAGLKRAIERARSRGRNGMTIGKNLDVSPHMRRPHFAVRWTEKGRSVPRLVPVKGCLVSRDKLFPVPTGHLDD